MEAQKAEAVELADEMAAEIEQLRPVCRADLVVAPLARVREGTGNKAATPTMV
jgi:hypothetical protein